MEYGLYLHIPYCRSRCLYCDFCTGGGHTAVPQSYMDALLRDFARFAPRDDAGQPLSPATVYFGGGTPSLLSGAQVAQVLQAVRPAHGAEVTLEANPESATAEKLAAWQNAGVNRLSLGVQTAHDDSLQRLGRLHTAHDAARALQNAHAVGFTNISGDIMLGLPGYTTAEFDDTLALLQHGGVTHVSAYLLKIEPHTPFGRQTPAGLPNADESADIYLYAVNVLQRAGYAQYEISNFALPGCESRHNLLYWDAQNWLGLGPAAHSHISGQRFSFAADVPAYLKNSPTPCPEGTLNAEDYIMLRLRLAGGLSENSLQQRFGVSLTKKQKALLQALCQNGYAVRHGESIALTPAGLLVQNTILARLLG